MSLPEVEILAATLSRNGESQTVYLGGPRCDIHYGVVTTKNYEYMALGMHTMDWRCEAVSVFANGQKVSF